jgi:hypothetical protein
MTPEEYTAAIDQINRVLQPSRSNSLDKALLATGVLMVPLALWGIRHAHQMKKRKRLLKRAIQDFNDAAPDLLMRWNRRPESFLSIERRQRVVPKDDNDDAVVQEKSPEDDADDFASSSSDSDASDTHMPIAMDRLSRNSGDKKSHSPLDEIHHLT